MLKLRHIVLLSSIVAAQFAIASPIANTSMGE
jgi:hypothetical protein